MDTNKDNYALAGKSECFLEMLESVSMFAKINRPVLILGERGTGKESVAARLHYLSPRWDAPRLTINCGALAPELLASELFGHEKGAFTGAFEARAGRFEMAEGGSLFLDEIANSSQILQEQILRVIEYGEYERVGSSHRMQADVRIIAATNENLSNLAASGSFRKDLLDRLSFAVIHVPPLRERKEDIPELLNFFGTKMMIEMGINESPKVSDKAMDSLFAWDWPGNIRELKNVVERAIFLAQGKTVKHFEINPFKFFNNDIEKKEQTKEDIAQETPVKKTTFNPCSFAEEIENFKIQLLKQALEYTHYNQKETATALNLTYDQFRGQFRKYKSSLTHT